MEVIQTPFQGVLVLKPKVHEDERGFFIESYSKRTLAEIGITTSFVQDNHSRSRHNTLRGMHYQSDPGQAKLLRVVSGEIWDVVVDLRRQSPTYGKWFAQTLSAENFLQLYVPVGFAHGFCVLSDSADLLYKCSSFYAPHAERGLAWDDPTIAIPWPIDDPVLSARDRTHPTLEAATTFEL